MTRIFITSFIMALTMFIALPTQAAPPGPNDVLAKYSFRLEIEGVDAGQFTSVDGLGIEQEVIEYQNGDDPLIRKRPGRVKYGDVTLTKEFTANSILNDWIENARLGSGDYERKTVGIILQDQAGVDIKRWTLFQSFPKSWSLSPLESGNSNSGLLESLVIVFEWFDES